jgi:site-specific recombinase XerD
MSVTPSHQTTGQLPHPHLFGHTFAANLLQKGVSLQTVAVLLGHYEQGYSHWTKARQENLQAEVKKSWAQIGTVEQASRRNR